jgi:hypothetical protein
MQSATNPSPPEFPANRENNTYLAEKIKGNVHDLELKPSELS